MMTMRCISVVVSDLGSRQVGSGRSTNNFTFFFGIHNTFISTFWAQEGARTPTTTNSGSPEISPLAQTAKDVVLIRFWLFVPRTRDSAAGHIYAHLLVPDADWSPLVRVY